MKSPLHRIIFFTSLFFLGLLRLALADETLPTAIHVHSDLSSGSRSISEIAQLAKIQNVEAVIVTDIYSERIEYGLWPFRNILKKSYEQNSLMKAGPEKYLRDIQTAAAKSGVLMIDGTAVTPFYYWTGSLWPGPLVLNNRGKDLLVLGLGTAAHYQNLPVIGNSSSRFDAYSGDQYSKPYQHFIDEARRRNGLVYWSHPYASEHIEFNHVFLGLDVFLDTAPYAEALTSTFHYTGFGIYSVELAQIHNPKTDSLASPKGIWDRLLMEYCKGKRESPLWTIGEVDYTGFADSIKNLDEILNMVIVPEKSREAVLNSLAHGQLYLVIPSSHDQHLRLETFRVKDSVSTKTAGLGEELSIEGTPVIQIQTRFSNNIVSQNPMQIILIRNGEVVQHWENSVPFELEFSDTGNTAPGKSYYRVLAYSEKQPDRLLTNPIFVQRQS